jgi:hypothetical protein
MEYLAFGLTRRQQEKEKGGGWRAIRGDEFVEWPKDQIQMTSEGSRSLVM